MYIYIHRYIHTQRAYLHGNYWVAIGRLLCAMEPPRLATRPGQGSPARWSPGSAGLISGASVQEGTRKGCHKAGLGLVKGRFRVGIKQVWGWYKVGLGLGLRWV